MNNESKTAKLYLQTGEIQQISPSNGADFKLDELQKLVGGLFEIIYLDSETILVVNEEGKYLKECEYNEHATMVAIDFNAIFPGDYICGNAILCETGMVK